ncbi:MAG: magnesium transporter [Bacteroidetes bacterium]|nr:magnesium transporter [Bacteroidota bacterium]
MNLELSKDYIIALEDALERRDLSAYEELLNEAHPADLAEILDKIDEDYASFFYEAIADHLGAEVLMELDEDLRAKLLEDYTGEEIALELIDNLDSDDAADLINELDISQRREVLENIEDQKQAMDIAGLLVYPEGTAGALMATEMIKVKDHWMVLECVREMRKQAEEVEQVHAIYVVNEDNKLLGTLSLKKLLTTSTRTPISEVYSLKVRSVEVNTEAEEVTNLMQKYDLVVMPVVDPLGHLVGRITIDDVVDFIRDEAKEDYNLASGLTDEVEAGDTIWLITRARLPWLLIGLFGGLLAASVIGRYEGDIGMVPQMAFFIPLIAAMGGNVGVQSSAIIVQGLASQSLGDNSTLSRLLKELGVALVNGLILSLLVIGASLFLGYSMKLALTVSVALFSVIVVAALIGTFVPLALDKYKIDPALATGPFITTLNDIIGLFLYFQIGRLILGL